MRLLRVRSRIVMMYSRVVIIDVAESYLNVVPAMLLL